uniref:WD repeat domain 4 n=1 Tax=Xiphophorus maculatus TaxID=8083 RepID=A0A3B5R389_XIPMA
SHAEKRLKIAKDVNKDTGSDTVLAFAVSSSGKLMAITDDTKRLILFQCEPSWHCISIRWVIRRCTSLVFSPAEDELLVADKSGDVYSFSVVEPEKDGELKMGHLSMLLAVTISADDQYIITADRDEKIRVSHRRSPYNIQSYCLGHHQAQPRVPRLSFFNRRHVGGIEEVFEVLCPPAHNVPSRGQQHTIPTINSVGAVLLPPHETPDGGPESLQSRTEVFLHGLSKLLPRQCFCLSNHLSRMPLRLPVPISCFRSPTGQKGPVGLFLQPDGIPHRRCPPTGTRVAASTGTDNLAATAPTGRLDNGGTEHSPLRLHVPHLPRDVFKVLPEMGVKAPSHRGFRQTFPADPHNTFGPARSDRLPPPPPEPTHHQVVVSGQLRTSLHPSVQDIRPQIR